MKKMWQSPRLIILARSKPQEAVLQVCKYYTGLTPHVDFVGCGYAVPDACVSCDGINYS